MAIGGVFGKRCVGMIRVGVHRVQPVPTNSASTPLNAQGRRSDLEGISMGFPVLGLVDVAGQVPVCARYTHQPTLAALARLAAAGCAGVASRLK